MAADADAIKRPSTAPDNVALERSLERLFRLTGNRRFDARQASAVGATVTRAGYALLRSLSDHGPLGLRELAAATYMDAAGASRQVAQLVDAGLIDRRAAEDDARAVELSLSDRGRDVYQRIVRHRLEHLAEVLSSWSAGDREVLAGLVDRLAADLGAAEIPRELEDNLR
jgi:DNA-binding MarR family transcriptional regulator